MDTSNWTEHERAVLAAYRAGRECDLSQPESDPAEAKPQLRAEVLSRLILSAPGNDAPPRLIIAGAHVTGLLDLGCATLVPFLFKNCTFDSEPMLNDAKADFVGFVDCSLPGLSASRLHCNGPVWLHGSEFSQSVTLEDAQVIDLVAHHILLKTANPMVSGFMVSGMRVEHDINLSRCEINGTLVARSCHVKGSFSLYKSILTPGSGRAFLARLLHVGGDLLCDEGAFGGRFDIEGAEIDGAAYFVSAKIGDEKESLNLDHSIIKLGVHASKLVATGTVSLHHATVSCQLSLSQATITTSAEYAIRADHAIIQGSLILKGGAEDECSRVAPRRRNRVRTQHEGAPD
ncbi:hypothetical protein [Mycobacterium sp. NS-7484]|uniref:hypothetical protein n=1 Tax=Mycobacterium sp. NS-7484 TaxID=1834161 RepID=UPI00114F26BF|nr:hypothetical protein [Mycobacterium sp. NS-7484]